FRSDRSDTAILYNDRSVLESHHVSAAYRLLQEDDEMNILYNLSKDDWRELRALVVEMVLATDMSCHFQQVKAMKNSLQQPEGIDKPKALSLLLHTADISHPAKSWDLHHRWTTSLLEEFFRQGDKESELGLPFSPLCDRKSTMVAQSQIGFIDFIVVPTFTVLTDMMERIVKPLIDEASHAGVAGFRRSSLNSISSDETKRLSSSSGQSSLLMVDLKNFKALWNEEVYQNRERWKSQAAKESVPPAKKLQTAHCNLPALHQTAETHKAEERAKRDLEEQAQQEEAMEPREVQTEPEQPEPTEDQPEGEEPGSAEVSQTPDGNTEEPEQEAQPESPSLKNPPLQNGELSEGTESPVGEENKNKGDAAEVTMD
ncbi:calcium/calmodulin-dependent 3',5'-cyclic nucleotide phosphodiesterase 1C-like, partial [Notothenia coriiceps]|uniref:Calcium/calmodulin-dependent 3',5'-cyclic nucleotide phosphodiesterase 1C-like n=1 Tax=Notothenia coriiceps TaxID=8208 RepID=A0A6I9NY74_9TELE